MERISLLLVDDHTILREGLRALLAEESDLVVIGEAQTCPEAVRLATRLHPAVVVMDFALPLLNGAEATRQILRAVPATKVLALSGYTDAPCLQQMLRAGAVGYLPKGAAANELAQAIREVHRGRPCLPADLAERLRQRAPAFLPAAPEGEEDPLLSVREAEVVQLVAEGYTQPQIAAQLGISPRTVEKHCQSAKLKLHVGDTAGLTRYAMAQRWLEWNGPAPLSPPSLDSGD